LTHRQICASLMINSHLLAGPAWNTDTCQVRQVVNVIHCMLHQFLQYWGIPIVLEQPELLEQNLRGNKDRRSLSQRIVQFSDERQNWISYRSSRDRRSYHETKDSSCGSHDNPRILNISSFARRWSASSHWLLGISSKSFGEFAAHFRNWNPPPFINWSLTSRSWMLSLPKSISSIELSKIGTAAGNKGPSSITSCLRTRIARYGTSARPYVMIRSQKCCSEDLRVSRQKIRWKSASMGSIKIWWNILTMSAVYT